MNWGLLGLPFGALALLPAITGIETYVRYREVTPQPESVGDAVLPLPPPTLRAPPDLDESVAAETVAPAAPSGNRR